MKTNLQLPIIGIPMGDPAGIGPEIIVKAFADSATHKLCHPLVFGNSAFMEHTVRLLKSDLRVNTVSCASQATFSPDTLNIVSSSSADLSQLKYGQISSSAGKCAYECIVNVTEAALNNEISGIATTPINKESIRAAKIDFIGHTEMLAALTHTENPLTMFQVKNLRVFFFSRHLSLKDACSIIKKDALVACLEQCNSAMNRLQSNSCCIAVAGLNPHCGEHGLFGDDEGREIAPAVAEAKRRGINAVGPVPADSVFHQALQGKYDAVLSLYHDQGHIATKTYDFERTISVTLGLPFIRTSVDHGTAFDIAGQGTASPISMIEAIRIAAAYSEQYRLT